jgi:helicase
MHPHEAVPIRYRIERFLRREDFRWSNPATGGTNAHVFSSVKTRAIAAAGKALPMRAAVVFAANKRGNQGAMGLAEELLLQIEKAHFYIQHPQKRLLLPFTLSDCTGY